MSHYDDLASLAIKSSAEFYTIKGTLERNAEYLIHAFRLYLGAPEGTVSVVELNSELLPTSNIVQKVDLVPSIDSCWYFGLQLHLAQPGKMAFGNVKLQFHVALENDGFRIHLDRDFHIKPSDERTLTDFFDHIIKVIKSDYEKPLMSPKIQIGFLQNA